MAVAEVALVDVTGASQAADALAQSSCLLAQGTAPIQQASAQTGRASAPLVSQATTV